MDPKGNSSSSSPSSTQPLSSLPLGSISLDQQPFPAATSESVSFTLEGFSPFEFDFTDPYETKPAIPAPSPVSFAPEIQTQLAAPQPLEWNPIPPFLSKTYDLVEELSLDPIISWGERGQSFVVWDPIEFARIVLPRHFKHNNFSSFVRQLNTYGFRKVDTDKWEFANECFMRGSKHLLKNIRRRRPPQSQQAISEASGSALEVELEKLRKEKGLLMQEVLELQRQHHGTAEHVKTVKERLQASEQRQKQMVSFLAKVFQNPEFIEHLKQVREQRLTRKKFIKQKPYQVSGQSDTSMDAHVFKHSVESTNLSSSEMLSVLPEHYLLQEFSTIPVQTQGGPSSSGGGEHSLYKGKELASPQLDYLIDFPEELAGGEALSEFPPPEPEIIKQREEQVLGMDFDFWSGVDDYNYPASTRPFISSGPSENLDVHTIRGSGSSVVDKWASDESPPGVSGTSKKNADDP